MNANKFLWLLRREYWEYRGGFLWAPLITAMTMLALCLLAILSAELLGQRHGIELGGIHLEMLTPHLSEEDAAKLQTGLDVCLLGLGLPIGVTLYFVTFFYCLGALYNDRVDRSVLFWKSLPLSDAETLAAKVVTAALLAPALAIVALITLQLGFLLLISSYALLHGIFVVPLLWSPTHLLTAWFRLILLIPIHALWALPTIGWLLLCSSYARSKPFLWAVLLPIVAGFFVWWFDLMRLVALPARWFWQNVVSRALFSLMPGSWVDGTLLERQIAANDGSDRAIHTFVALPVDRLLEVLALPNLWIGAAAGAAMIALAIHLRRRRIEAFA
jgi:ABC-2 type transport system permease protein